jgi:hypothetical protein
VRLTAHYRNLKESIEVLDEAIEKGVLKRQRSIGFHASAAAADMYEIMYEIILHRQHLIDMGFVLKHDWFASTNKIRDKLPFDFAGKKSFYYSW